MKISGGIHIDLFEKPKGIYLIGEYNAIHKLADDTLIPSGPFKVTGIGVEIEIYYFDFSVDGAAYVPVLPTGVTFLNDIVTIDPATVTFKTLAIRASSVDAAYSAVFTVTVTEDGKKGDKGDSGTNYLILGWWSPTTSYKLSDAGIPVVKVADGTAAGYSAYKLITAASTTDLIPPNAEWQLVESVEFLYMQDAYIERLQAALVTAEKIESLMIRTSNIEILNGAIVGGELRANSGYFEGLIRMPFKNNPKPDWWLSAEGDHPILSTIGSTNIIISPNTLVGSRYVYLPTANINGYRIIIINAQTLSAANNNGYDGSGTISAGTLKIINPDYGYSYDTVEQWNDIATTLDVVVGDNSPNQYHTASTMTINRGELIELIGIDGIPSQPPNNVTGGWLIIKRRQVLSIQ